MRIPNYLDGEAAKFWQRNAPAMIADGRLNELTRDAFILLCETWADWVNGRANQLDANKVVALGKQCQNQMAAFGMTPASRKRLKLDTVTGMNMKDIFKLDEDE